MKQKDANPLQGKLFMSAREIMATHDPNQPDRFFHGTDVSVSRASSYKRGDEYVPPETNDQLYQRKLGEANKSGLTDDLRTHGVNMPIMLATETQGASGKPNVAGGHHRLAAMSHLNPDQLLPVMPVNHVLGAHAAEAQIWSEDRSRRQGTKSAF
jgi:hypothetical protein